MEKQSYPPLLVDFLNVVSTDPKLPFYLQLIEDIYKEPKSTRIEKLNKIYREYSLNIKNKIEQPDQKLEFIFCFLFYSFATQRKKTVFFVLNTLTNHYGKENSIEVVSLNFLSLMIKELSEKFGMQSKEKDYLGALDLLMQVGFIGDKEAQMAANEGAVLYYAYRYYMIANKIPRFLDDLGQKDDTMALKIIAYLLTTIYSKTKVLMPEQLCFWFMKICNLKLGDFKPGEVKVNWMVLLFKVLAMNIPTSFLIECALLTDQTEMIKIIFKERNLFKLNHTIPDVIQTIFEFQTEHNIKASTIIVAIDRLIANYIQQVFEINSGGSSLLHEAVMYSDRDGHRIQELLSWGAYYDILDHRGKTPDKYSKKYSEIFRRIQKLFLHAANSNTPFKGVSPKLRQKMITQGILGARRVLDGNTPLQVAILHHNHKFLDEFFKHWNDLKWPISFRLRNKKGQDLWDVILENAPKIDMDVIMRIGGSFLSALKRGNTAEDINQFLNIYESMKKLIFSMPKERQIIFLLDRKKGILEYISDPNKAPFMPLEYFAMGMKCALNYNDFQYKRIFHEKMAEFFLTGKVCFKKISKGLEEELVLSEGPAVLEEDTDETRDLRHLGYLYHCGQVAMTGNLVYMRIAAQFSLGSHLDVRGFPEVSFGRDQSIALQSLLKNPISGYPFQSSGMMLSLLHLKAAQQKNVLQDKKIQELEKEIAELKTKSNGFVAPAPAPAPAASQDHALLFDEQVEFEIEMEVDDSKSVLGKHPRDEKAVSNEEGASPGPSKRAKL